MYTFFQSELTGLNQMPSACGIGLMPEGHGLLCRIDGRPHIFADSTSMAYRPRFIQERMYPRTGSTFRIRWMRPAVIGN